MAALTTEAVLALVHESIRQQIDREPDETREALLVRITDTVAAFRQASPVVQVLAALAASEPRSDIAALCTDALDAARALAEHDERSGERRWGRFAITEGAR